MTVPRGNHRGTKQPADHVVSNATTYDLIGTTYSVQRRPDERWTRQIHRHVRDGVSLVNVGAGAGSYEPGCASVVAVEPSDVMIRQRAVGSAPAVRAVAERLPFRDHAFDMALGILTVHHWRNPHAGLAEMQRVSFTQAVVTWDPAIFAREFWFVRDYLPHAAIRERSLATLSLIAEALQPHTVEALPVPAGCTDGFFGAYWRRPEAYLDPRTRASISGLALLDDRLVTAAVERLRCDLRSGAWHERYADLLALDEVDLGYRLVVSGR
jgi:hypothetical protein